MRLLKFDKQLHKNGKGLSDARLCHCAFHEDEFDKRADIYN